AGSAACSLGGKRRRRGRLHQTTFLAWTVSLGTTRTTSERRDHQRACGSQPPSSRSAPSRETSRLIPKRILHLHEQLVRSESKCSLQGHRIPRAKIVVVHNEHVTQWAERPPQARVRTKCVRLVGVLHKTRDL